MEHEKIDCYHWKLNYNMFECDKSLWSATLRYMNILRYYDRVIKPYNKNEQEPSIIQERRKQSIKIIEP